MTAKRWHEQAGAGWQGVSLAQMTSRLHVKGVRTALVSKLVAFGGITVGGPSAEIGGGAFRLWTHAPRVLAPVRLQSNRGGSAFREACQEKMQPVY